MAKPKKRQYRFKQVAVGLIAGLSCQGVGASAFQLQEQNISGLGTAHAGAASIAEDASTGFYNAAGLTRLGQEQIAVSSLLISSHSKLKVAKANPTFPAFPPAPSMGAGSARSKVYALLPGLHYFQRINDRFVWSLNVTSPFGLQTTYKNDSLARYMATQSALRTVNIGPSVAYDLQNGWSVGAGVDALYAEAKLNSRLGSGSPANDGFIENKASNWGTGYHAGVLYEVSPQARVGLSYRSKVKINARGDSRLVVVPSFTPLTIQSVKASITLPETLALSGYYDLGNRWAVMADVQWTAWKRYKDLVLRFQDGTTATTPQDFKNTFRYALGASYQLDSRWKLRVGGAFEQSPMGTNTRTVRIPDQKRTWAAVGGQYKVSQNLALDIGYAHGFFKKANINERAPLSSGMPTLQSLEGTSRSRVDLIGIQLTWDLV